MTSPLQDNYNHPFLSSLQFIISGLLLLFLSLSPVEVYGQQDNSSYKNNSLFLILDQQGNVQGEIACSSLQAAGKRSFLKKSGGHYQLVSRKDSALSPPFDSIGEFQYSIAKTYNKNHKGTGILRSNGQTFPGLFSKVFIESPGLVRGRLSQERIAALSGENGPLWELLDTTGQLIVPPYYRHIGRVSHNRLRVKKQNHWGYINPEGRTILSFVLDSAGNFGEFYAPGKTGQKSMLVSPDGILHTFNAPFPPDALTKRLLRIRKDSLYGLMTIEKDTLVQPDFSQISKLNRNTFSIWKNNLCGLVNNHGKLLKRPVYDSIHNYSSHGFLQCFTGKTTHFYDLSRDSVTLNSSKLTYKLLDISEGFIQIKRKGNYGFIDHLGRNRIAYRYQDALPITEGLARIMIRGKWGVVNKKEDLLIQPYYEKIGPFQNGLAAVRYQGEWGIIDKNGKMRIPHIHDTAYYHSKGYWILKKDGKKGILTGDGNHAFHPRFSHIKQLSSNFFAVRKNGVTGVMDASGNTVIPPQYHDIRYSAAAGCFIAQTTQKD